MKFIYALISLASFNLFADVNSYYQDLKPTLEKHELKNENLTEKLYSLLTHGHKAVGYESAKRYIFGDLHMQKDVDGNFFVQDVYCNKIIKSGVGPGLVPSNDKLNIEHTWPQSKFSGSFDNEMQKSDMHHLYPTDSKANSIRSNNRFADVSSNRYLKNDCTDSKSGPSTTSGGDRFFEPPTEHKGNVARALFYFSVRYKLKINSKELEVLRRWNDLDPVDENEVIRNDKIEKLQGNRNPFIDFPSLASDIDRF